MKVVANSKHVAVPATASEIRAALGINAADIAAARRWIRVALEDPRPQKKRRPAPAVAARKAAPKKVAKPAVERPVGALRLAARRAAAKKATAKAPARARQ